MSLAMLVKPFFNKPQEKAKNPENDGKLPENVLVYIVPSLLDVVGTIFDTAGIFYTNVSVSQMLKGFVVVFTYLISILCFRKTMRPCHHIGVLLIFLGEVVIGYSNIDTLEAKFCSRPMLGNALIIVSQFIFSLMFVYEELLLKHYRTQVVNIVAWEGVWGLLGSALFLFVFSFFNYKPTNCNFFETCQLIYGNSTLLLAILVTGLCIAPFNYFGMRITQMSSALHRCTICTLRMVVVWMVSLLLGWEQFNWTQLAGYVVLTVGTFVFNQVWKMSTSDPPVKDEEEVAQLVN